MKRDDTATKQGKNAAFRGVFADSQRFIACLAFALLTLVCSSASLASADQRAVQTRSATMNVSAQVIAHCDVVSRPQSAGVDVLSTFDVTCPRMPNARIEKNPTIHTVEGGRQYVVTTILL
jgi:hypothetical protein